MARIKKMEVYPVAGKDCMELNLAGHTHRILQEISLSSMTKTEKPV